jgi:drug/metabolite transporter (DMT)-like permease
MTAHAPDIRPPAAQSLRAAALAALAMWLFSVQDAFFKAMSEDYSVVTILFLRSVGIVPIAAWLVWCKGGPAAFHSERLGLQLLRGGLLFSMFLGYYLALTRLPLATAVALIFSAPLMTTLLSVPILGERVGGHRLAAVLVGFLGVLIMVRPGGEVFGWPALLCLAASLCYSLSMVLTRHLAGTESIGTLVFYPNLIFLLGSAALLPANWTPVTLEHGGLILSFGLCTLLAHFSITQAYRIAPPPVVAPFDYTTLVWALLWGWLLWDELPDMSTLAGALVVVLAGLYVIYRESRLERERPAPQIR